MSKKIFNHEGNSSGRDFIVGDLHGYRSPLESMLCEVALYNFAYDALETCNNDAT